MQIHTLTQTSSVIPALEAPVFHRAVSAGQTIGRARRFYAEADLLADDANDVRLGAALRAALRRDASTAHRSAQRTLLSVSH
ncbi:MULTISPECIES: hypothetical protein [Gluconobacter]|uniref:hypothetical protein n=1 Tax=Gluconobacter TaxID=441 RepID=UPI0007860D35|nr:MULTISPECIES: hypothetical protein [Gluconobacter]KXV22023.1 hypothetical protein AD935_05510 [Gluconobacter japonicus]MBS0983473.1 hypothetical protein [Gluconobacter cerinus]